MALALEIGQCTLLGNYRENNEDAVAVCHLDGSTLALVADGMGGQAAGEIASRRAIEIVPRELRRSLRADATPAEISEALANAFQRASAEIIALGDLDPDIRSMGTTLVAVLQRHDDAMFVAHLGDSRAYILRDDRTEQLTVDHNIAEALRQSGAITDEEARVHRGRNILWKFIGNRSEKEGPDLKVLSVKAGDSVLLCTDGLTGVVEDEAIRQVVQDSSTVQECAEALGQLALDSGSRDNVSCIVIRFVTTKNQRMPSAGAGIVAPAMAWLVNAACQ